MLIQGRFFYIGLGKAGSFRLVVNRCITGGVTGALTTLRLMSMPHMRTAAIHILRCSTKRLLAVIHRRELVKTRSGLQIYRLGLRTYWSGLTVDGVNMGGTDQHNGLTNTD